MRVLLVKRRGGTTFEIPMDRDVLLIGRSAACDVQLPDPAVSFVHARIERRHEGVFVCDADSKNGTVVDDEAVDKHGKRLGVDSQIRINDFEISLVDQAETTKTSDAPPKDSGTATLARQLLSDALGALGVPRLEIEAGPDRGRTFPIHVLGETIKVGRSQEAGLRLSDADVSRFHLEIRRDWSGVTLRDAGTKNGTLRNAAPIRDEVRLRDGDFIVLGKTTMRFVDNAHRELERLGQPAHDEIQKEKVFWASSQVLIPVITATIAIVLALGILLWFALL